MLAAGTEIDRYVVEAQIGEGGMAAVYRVRHTTLGTRHALKVLQIANKDVRERTIQEGQVQAKLRHPHVVSVTDVLDIDGSPGLLMEFVRGPALDHWLYQYQPSIEEALTLFRGIVSGVGYAHSKGLVHRDLKSANIMLQIDDDVGIIPKVTDFGLAKVARPDGRKTRSGTTMGTPTFMAPEQIRDASTVDRRADLYSLGCVLYELVCGRTPHVGDDVIDLFAQVASGQYPHPRELRPDVPNRVVDCIEALVEVNADYRPTDCAAILELLAGGDRNTFSVPLAPEGELPPARPMPDPGRTTLDHGSPGAARAALFLSQLSTPPMVIPQDPGSLAPIQADFENPTVQVDIDRRASPEPAPVRRFGALTLVALLGPVAIGVGLAIGIIVLGVGVYLRSTTENGEGVVDVEPVPESPRPVATPAPPEPAPAEPWPGPSEPTEVVRPHPSRPVPSPVPPPTKPDPAPVTKPKIVEKPSTAGSTFTASGASRVRLSLGTASYGPGDPVPPGRYTILAGFDGGAPTPAGKVTVRAGQALTITCDPAFRGCIAR